MCVPGSVIASCLVLLLGGRPLASPRTSRTSVLRGVGLPGVASWRVPVLPEQRFWERFWIPTEKG